MSDDRRKESMSNRFNRSTDNNENNGVAQDSTQEDNNDAESQSGTSEDGVEDNGASQDDNDEPTVRDTVGRTFYVGEERLDELDGLYREMAYKYGEEYGEDLQKNKVFYPAIFRAVVNHPEIVADELGLGGDDE